MGLIAKRPIDVNNKDKKMVEDLMTSIIKGNAVLVLGHEGILANDYCEGNVRKYIVKSFFDYKKMNNENFGSCYENFDDCVYDGGADIAKLKEEIVDMLNNQYNFDNVQEYSPLIFKLLSRRYFRLVLTTTYDHYVEHMMYKAWTDDGDTEEDVRKKVRILNIFEEKEKKDLNPNEVTYNDLQPTLYYIFGKAEEGKDFTVTENDAMKVTKKWMNEAEAPRELLNYLKDKTIIALGTKFDDWLFRFFWFSLHRDDKDLRNGRVAISLSDLSETERNLKRYLKKQKIDNPNFEELISLILNNYEEHERKFMSQNARDAADIFISYRSRSYESVKHLFYAMYESLNNCDMHTKIWFDRNTFDENGLNPGADYTERIINAINSTRIFVPVISKSVVDVLESDEPIDNFYFLKEWQQALSRQTLQNKKLPLAIIPICIDGVDIERIKPHPSKQELFKLVNQETVGTSKNPSEFKKFLTEIENVLKQKY